MCIPMTFKHSSLAQCTAKDQSSFYEIRSLAICINTTIFNRVNRKQLNILKTFFEFLEFFWLFTEKMIQPQKLLDKLQKQPPDVFCKKRCSQKFHKIHRKRSVPESLFCRSKTSNFIKKETLTQVFSCEFCKISKKNFSTEHLLMTACL